MICTAYTSFGASFVKNPVVRTGIPAATRSALSWILNYIVLYETRKHYPDLADCVLAVMEDRCSKNSIRSLIEKNYQIMRSIQNTINSQN